MSTPTSSFPLQSSGNTPASRRPTTVSYEKWNQAIADYFFNSTKNGQPVYLQADAEAIQFIGQQFDLLPDEAETSFLDAVRRYIFETKPHATNIIMSAKYKHRDVKPPYFIGFLAFCVLAASRMERDEELGITAANYYHHLNEMLRLERGNAPPWFAEASTIAWPKLEEWLHEVHEGRYGIATARPLNSVHPYVSYPQSQCLLRAADRQHLPAFFRWARLQPGDIPPRTWVLNMLKRWAKQPGCSLSRFALRRISESSSEVNDPLLAITLLELQAWDDAGPATSTTTMPSEDSLLHITIHSAARQISWYHYTGEALIPLSSLPAMFAHVPDAPGKAVIVFGDHPDAGQWTRIPRATLGAMHVLLVHESHESDVRAFLAKTARPTWQEQTLRGIPPGWLCFRGVELVRADPNAPWDCLSIQDNVTVRLQGGLSLGRNVYMAGFEPILIIDGPDHVTPILLNEQPLPDHTGGQTVIPLAPYCSKPGYHTVCVGSRTRSFITRSSHRSVITSWDVIGIALRRKGDHYVPHATGPIATTSPLLKPETIYVSGAAIYGRPEDFPEPLPHTVVTQDGFRRYIVIGRQPGEIFEHHSTFILRKDIQAARQLQISFDVPFEPQWLVKVGRKKHYLSAIQLYLQPPVRTLVGSLSQCEAWIRVVCRKSFANRLSQEQQATWQLYNAVGTKLKATR